MHACVCVCVFVSVTRDGRAKIPDFVLATKASGLLAYFSFIKYFLRTRAPAFTRFVIPGIVHAPLIRDPSAKTCENHSSFGQLCRLHCYLPLLNVSLYLSVAGSWFDNWQGWSEHHQTPKSGKLLGFDSSIVLS